MDSYELNMDINQAMSICLRNSVYVMPEIEGSKFVIVVVGGGFGVRYDKLVSGKEVATACSKTYKHVARLIINKQEEDGKLSRENQKELG